MASNLFGVPEDDADVKEAQQALQNASDHTRALMMCAYLEHALEGCLLSRMRQDLDKRTRRGLFRNFHGKIDLCYAMKAFGPQTRQDLHTIREVRNIFAHSGFAIDFGTKEIARLCFKIQALQRDKRDAARPQYYERLKVESPQLAARGMFYSSSLLLLGVLRVEPKVPRDLDCPPTRILEIYEPAITC